MNPVLSLSRADFKSLSPEDFSQIVELEQNCGLDDPYDPELLRELFTRMDNFICRMDGRIIGFITLNRKSLYLGGSIYIININVDRTHRGRGVAKRLMLAAFEYCMERCPDGLVSLDVMKTNRAKELYRKVGFRVMDVPSRNGDADLVMAAPLRLLERNLRRLLAHVDGCSRHD